ncbi:PE domain-containing protein [Mycobacterium sp. Marseille-P9652]|uniref:PE domain-containing protein n=1 Tax=Mycobacterium sp. Marseille-P9652 TaxID=2654950 RepID=UPI0012E76249|nr:PE domain-containing protein [Mycobacterium sp. Marseille-P9652]
MSFLNVAPDAVGQVAGQLENIGSALAAANAAAAAPTNGVIAPALDEVSAAITALMGNHAQEYRALSSRLATFHTRFVQNLSQGAAAYASTDAAAVGDFVVGLDHQIWTSVSSAFGPFNSGNNNIGFFNTGSYNIGFYNVGSYNTGFYNVGNSNIGLFNEGTGHIGISGGLLGLLGGKVLDIVTQY